jgi:hypothetical protein
MLSDGMFNRKQPALLQNFLLVIVLDLGNDLALLNGGVQVIRYAKPYMGIISPPAARLL